MTFGHRRVNDQPDDCASSTLPSLAVENDKAHLVWIDNRYGTAGVFYASCPVNGACSANEYVSDTAFDFTFRRDTQGWLGDYNFLAVRNQVLWAFWADSRLGRSAIYAARGVPAP
jgi:hypothetical protein